MKLKTYQAFTMAEALSAVKQNLGDNAVILQTRTFKRGGVLGLGARNIVEVTATEAEANEESTRRPVTSSETAARRAYRTRPVTRESARTGAAAVAAALEAATAATPRPAVSALRSPGKVQSPAAALVAGIAHSDDVFEPSQPNLSEFIAPSPKRPSEISAIVPAPTPLVTPLVTSEAIVPRPRADVARRYILQPAQADAATPGTDDHVETAVEVVRSAALAEAVLVPTGVGRVDGMQEELVAIREMVGQVLEHQSTGRQGSIPAMPEPLFDLYMKLVGQELSEELADRIMAEVRIEFASRDMDDEVALRESVMRHLSAIIPVADDSVTPRPDDGRPLTIALVGPTGVGKTTTLAKLAASFKLRHGRRVGLVTADTYRIAAVDQLRTYADIIGLPLEVALAPEDMQPAIDRLGDCDVVLIDTAGRSQNDHSRLLELKAFMDAASPHEVHLVLSSTAGEKVMLREAEAFSTVGVGKVVLTKLDEAVSFGVVINVVRRIGKELSFLTTGQEVPDHIERGSSLRLADLVLGGKVHA